MANLYTQVRAALDRQTGDGGPTHAAAFALQNDRGNGQNTRANDNGQPPPPMTASQRRAIETICRRRGADPIAESRQQIGAEFDRLTLREASHLIDGLKAMETATRNGGGP